MPASCIWLISCSLTTSVTCSDSLSFRTFDNLFTTSIRSTFSLPRSIGQPRSERRAKSAYIHRIHRQKERKVAFLIAFPSFRSHFLLIIQPIYFALNLLFFFFHPTSIGGCWNVLERPMLETNLGKIGDT